MINPFKDVFQSDTYMKHLNADEVKSGYRPDTGGATVHGQSESSITPPTTTATSPTHPS